MTAKAPYTLSAVLASLFAGSVGLGISSPLLGLAMNAAGLARTVIGLNTAMFALAIILFAPAAPRLMKRFGSAGFLVGSLLVSAAMLLLIRWFEPGWVWFPVRLVMGCGFAGLWVVTESAVNQLAAEHRRGLLIGIYATTHTLGFAAGALLIQQIGIEGWRPYLIAAAAMVIASLPVLFAGPLPVPAVEAQRSHIRGFVSRAPFIMMGALVFGLADMGVLAMLPVYGVRAGLTEPNAAFLLVAAQVANPFIQVPLGALADRVSRRDLLIMMAGLGLTTAVLLGPALAFPFARFFVLLVMGGALFAIYSLSLTLLGERFRGGSLAEANASFVFIYGVGALIGPPLSGLAMDLFDPWGLLLVLGAVCGGYLMLGLFARRA